MFKGKEIDPESGEDYICSIMNTPFNRTWVEGSDVSLSTPRPSVSAGYALHSWRSDRYPTAFNLEEAVILSEDCLTEQLYCPFLTSQWKTSKDSMLRAERQAACDGVTVNDYLMYLFETSGIAFTERDNQYWSLTINAVYVILWLHWVEDRSDGSYCYHIRAMHAAFFHPNHGEDIDPSLIDLTHYLRNILEDAQTHQLDRIKEAIVGIWKKKYAIRTARRFSQTVRFRRGTGQVQEDDRGSKVEIGESGGNREDGTDSAGGDGTQRDYTRGRGLRSGRDGRDGGGRVGRGRGRGVGRGRGANRGGGAGRGKRGGEGG
jgi:hypothetical protein